MAINYEGLFVDPAELRAKRWQDIQNERSQIAQMGGSMNQLLGQVAAGGANTGRAMAEAAGGMFGLKTPEEKKASELNAMAANFDTSTAQGLAQFAKALNDAGMTREAVAVMAQRQKVVEQERATTTYDQTQEDRKRLIAQGKLRERRETVMVEKLDSKGKPTGVMEPKTVYYTEVWNEQKQKWERESNAPMQSQTQGGYVMSEGGGARVPQGTKVAPPQTKYQTKQNEQDATIDPWSTFTRY